jgi:hypothetical protein
MKFLSFLSRVLCHVIVFNTYKTLIKPTQRLTLALASKQWPKLVDQISNFGCGTLLKNTLGTGAVQPPAKDVVQYFSAK